jgi:hypothetical protein
MMGSREGFRERRRRKKAARESLAAKADMVRAETRERAAEKARAERLEQAEAADREKARSRAEVEARKLDRKKEKEARARERARRSARPKPPKAKRESLRARRRRRKRSRKSMSRSERVALHRSQFNELWIWIKGVGLELRRRARIALAPVRDRIEPVRRTASKRLAPVGAAVMSVLRPVGRGLRAVLAPIAPLVSGALFFALRVLAAIPVYILAAFGWTWDRAVAIARAIGRWVDAHVTPARTFAAIALLAAIALAVSQFVDYRATAIGADQYEGEVQTVAPPPRIDEEPAGEAHFYALLPLAVIAVPLILLALGRRRWRLAVPVAAIGLIGIIVTLAVDLPQGLDTGRAGDAYEGTEALLIEGFWTQLFASAALLLSGIALGRAVRRPEERSRPRPVGTSPAHEPRGRRATAGEGAGA